MSKAGAATSSTPPASSIRFWVACGVCATLALVLLIQLILIFTGKDAESARAYEAGQRLIIPADGSAIQGNMHRTEPEATIEEIPTAAPVEAQPAEPANDFSQFVGGETLATNEQRPTALTEAATMSNLVGGEDVALTSIAVEPRTNASLAEAPNPSLVKPSPEGLLPQKGGGTSPFEYYRRPAGAVAADKPRIAIIISELGSAKAPTEQALTLPLNTTLAFSAYAKNAPVWMESARNKGYESWLMLPAQPDDFPASDPGPNALLIERDAETELTPRLHRVMGRTSGYVGFVLPVNEAFSDNIPSLKWLGEQLEARGLGLIAAEKPKNSATAGWFAKRDEAYAADRVLDATLNEQAIRTALNELEEQARQTGKAMGSLRAYPLSLTTFRDWQAGLAQRGVVLVPASQLAEK